MKALEMRMAWSLKAHRHFRLCLRCGHMNNGEKEDLTKRICMCAEPILIDPKYARGMSLGDLRELPEFRHLFGGKDRTIIGEDEVDMRSRYREEV